MIRKRREEDLDRLCMILETMKYPSGLLSAKDRKEWLKERHRELSWVFDMAPVSVAPTKNVVGHVQIVRVTEDSSAFHLARYTKEPAQTLLAIGKLFIRPNTYESGIGRYLLKESVKYIKGQGKIPVLDLHGNGSLTKELCAKLGFQEVSSTNPGVAPMIHTA